MKRDEGLRLDCMRFFDNICEIYPTAGPDHLADRAHELLDELLVIISSSKKRNAVVDLEEPLTASELLSMVAHESAIARVYVSAKAQMNQLLVAIANWKNADPEYPEEIEWCENCHSTLRRILLDRPAAKATFADLEGMELSLRILKVGLVGQLESLKLMDVVTTHNVRNSQQLIDSGGLKLLFPLWMDQKKQQKKKKHKTGSEADDSHEVSEEASLVMSIISNLCVVLAPDDIQWARLRAKFLEPEKLERLIFLHQEYAQEVAGRVQELDEEDKAENDDDDDEVNPEDKEYLDLLEHGLDKLQKIDVVLARLLSDRTILDESGSSPATRVKQLCLNGGGSTILDDVRKEVADYAEKLVVLNASQEVDEEQTAEIKANLVRFALFEV